MRKVLPRLWRIVRRFWPQVRKQRGLVGGSMLALLAEVALRLLEPWPLKLIFDHLIVATPQTDLLSGITWIDAMEPTSLLTFATLGLVGVVGLRALASYYHTVGFALVGNRVLTDVRAELYRHLQALSMSFHTKAKNGDLVVRVIGDVGLLKEVTVTAAMPLLAHTLVLLGMVVVMFCINWRLALLAMSVVPLFWLSTTRLSRRISDAARQQRRRESDMAATTAESMGAIKTVQALSLEEKFAGLFTRQNKKSLKDGVKAKRLAASLERTVQVLVALATALVLWYGARLVLRHAMTPGDLLVFLAYLKSAFRPVQRFAKYTGRLAKASAAGDRVLDILDQQPDVRDLPGARHAGTIHGDVCFENVGFSYESGHPVFQDIDFCVPAGQRVALAGPSGIGKSTLVSLIMRLYDADTGRVTIDGHDVRHYTLASLLPQISVVLQDTLLFAATVAENIAYAMPGATPDQIRDAARLANADGFIRALPQGYDTVLGERGATLSGGQRQRIAIARVAIRQAPILILDEPTTGLDKDNRRLVDEALQKLCVGRTTFIISHDMQLSSLADRIFYLDHGRIAESGTHEQLLCQNGRYAQLYRLQTAMTHRQPSSELHHAASA